MPELPEVETIVREIRPQTVGRTIAGVRLGVHPVTHSELGSFRRMKGLRFQRLDRHGKWMFFRLSDQSTLAIHLGMTGRLAVVDADALLPPHTHLRLELDEGFEELRFSDARRFGRVAWCRPQTVAERFGPDRLGLEATTITGRELAEALTGRRRPVKTLLLDQRTIAGVGNIYADEILFAARLDPAMPAHSLTPPQVRRLHRALQSVLARAIRHGGTTIRDYVTSRGVPGEFQRHLCVYGRSGEPCPNCSGPIALSRTVVSGRPTHWCPVCQDNTVPAQPAAASVRTTRRQRRR